MFRLFWRSDTLISSINKQLLCRLKMPSKTEDDNKVNFVVAGHAYATVPFARSSKLPSLLSKNDSPGPLASSTALSIVVLLLQARALSRNYFSSTFAVDYSLPLRLWEVSCPQVRNRKPKEKYAPRIRLFTLLCKSSIYFLYQVVRNR